MGATLSLLGLYQYNPQLFDGLRLPAEVDKNILVDNLLAECAEFEILYPDPFFLANMIGVWSEKEFATWEKLANTLKLEYDPISNYDRTEEWDNTNNSNIKNNGNTVGTDVKKVAGYNNENFANSEEFNNTVVTNIESKADASDKRRGHIYGNIGVTTTQQMIEEERRVVKFNITDYIIDSFKRRFCLLIY